MVKIERSYPPPKSLSLKRSYKERDVIERLQKDFFGKCYICGLNQLPDINVEHLFPHKEDIIKKFDWDNLFLSCPHCNSVKNKKEYEDKILDCCKIDPEEKINFEFNEEDINIFSKDESDEKAVQTSKLIYEVFNIKNTGIREYTSHFRFKALQEEMLIFFNILEEYNREKNNFSLRSLKEKLKRESRFAAFKRNYMRKNIKKYSEFKEILEYNNTIKK